MMLDVLSDGRPNLDETSETQLPKKTWESCINVSETEWDFLRYTTSSTRCSPFLAMAGVPLAILHVRSVFSAWLRWAPVTFPALSTACSSAFFAPPSPGLFSSTVHVCTGPGGMGPQRPRTQVVCGAEGGEPFVAVGP